MPLSQEERFFASLRMTIGGRLRMTMGDQSDRGREGRFFAALRMTEGARNDKGRKLSF